MKRKLVSRFREVTVPCGPSVTTTTVHNLRVPDQQPSTRIPAHPTSRYDRPTYNLEHEGCPAEPAARAQNPNSGRTVRRLLRVPPVASARGANRRAGCDDSLPAHIRHQLIQGIRRAEKAIPDLAGSRFGACRGCRGGNSDWWPGKHQGSPHPGSAASGRDCISRRGVRRLEQAAGGRCESRTPGAARDRTENGIVRAAVQPGHPGYAGGHPRSSGSQAHRDS